MFRFDFDLGDGLDETTFTGAELDEGHNNIPNSASQQTGVPFTEIELNSLLAALPTQLSYSFVSVPSPDGHSPDLKVARRDLFDARFQLISEGTPGDDLERVDHNLSTASALQFIDNPSDLVPLVYEGGLKTWECSLDLAACLRRGGRASTNVKGRRVLELGCGAAIPSLCLLQDIFASSIPADGSQTETHMHLQDYNASVLELVTLPNVVLAWYTSPAATAYRSSEPHANDVDIKLELHISPQLLDAFKTSLCDHRLHLHFFAGSWAAFGQHQTGSAGGPDLYHYDLILTSETIYNSDTLPSLVQVLQNVCSGSGKNRHGGVICDTFHPCCFVAAKTVYFGVGGGVLEFIQCVELMGGQVETIWETSTGISRRVMDVCWT